jgi:feruloyl esterase
LADCDGLDGIVDGLVGDSASCHFKPARLQCADDKTDACLSQAQVSALLLYIAGPHDSTGRPLYVDWPWDPGFASPGWRAWKLGTSTTALPNAIKAGLSNNAIRYVFLTPPQPDMTEAQFDFDHDPARMEAAAAFADAISTDLARFKAHAGKIIFYHGLADPAISARDTERYYQALTQAQGGLNATLAFARLFLVPGMNHCSGGNGLDSFDPLSAIVSWVEKGEPPRRLKATGQAMPGISRPLCPYPATARYSGGGDARDEKNFSCE